MHHHATSRTPRTPSVLARRLAWVAIGAILPVLSACSLRQPAPDRAQFLLSAPISARPDAPRSLRPVVVEAAVVAAPFAGRMFVYRLGADSYKPDPYNGFLAAPSAMITDSTIRWLRSRGPFSAVGGAGISIPREYRLQQVVEELYAQFLPDRNMAVVRVRYFLTDERATPADIVLDRAYVGTAPLSDGEPETVAVALNLALKDALEQLSRDLSALPSGG